MKCGIICTDDNVRINDVLYHKACAEKATKDYQPTESVLTRRDSSETLKTENGIDFENLLHLNYLGENGEIRTRLNKLNDYYNDIPFEFENDVNYDVFPNKTETTFAPKLSFYQHQQQLAVNSDGIPEQASTSNMSFQQQASTPLENMHSQQLHQMAVNPDEGLSPQAANSGASPLQQSQSAIVASNEVGQNEDPDLIWLTSLLQEPQTPIQNEYENVEQNYYHQPSFQPQQQSFSLQDQQHFIQNGLQNFQTSDHQPFQAPHVGQYTSNELLYQASNLSYLIPNEGQQTSTLSYLTPNESNHQTSNLSYLTPNESHHQIPNLSYLTPNEGQQQTSCLQNFNLMPEQQPQASKRSGSGDLIVEDRANKRQKLCEASFEKVDEIKNEIVFSKEKGVFEAAKPKPSTSSVPLSNKTNTFKAVQDSFKPVLNPYRPVVDSFKPVSIPYRPVLEAFKPTSNTFQTKFQPPQVLPASFVKNNNNNSSSSRSTTKLFPVSFLQNSESLSDENQPSVIFQIIDSPKKESVEQVPPNDIQSDDFGNESLYKLVYQGDVSVEQVLVQNKENRTETQIDSVPIIESSIYEHSIRHRAVIKADFRVILEEAFTKTEFPNRAERVRLGLLTDLDQRQVQIWFQNQRSKKKKGAKEFGGKKVNFNGNNFSI